MHLGGKAARREKEIDLFRVAIDHPGIAPNWRRTFGNRDATQTLGLLARAAIELPQDVGGADEPILMSRVNLEWTTGVRIEREDARSEERRVVVVNHVGPRSIQDLADLCLLEKGPSGLLSQQRRKPSGSAAQAVHGHVPILDGNSLGRSGMEKVIGIDTVNDVDSMPSGAKSRSQSLDVNRVTAETVWRVERR